MSIEYLKFVADKDISQEYIKENAQYSIPFSALLTYWSYATADDFEGGSAKGIDDYIVGSCLRWADKVLIQVQIAADTMTESEPIDYECACNINDYNDNDFMLK